MCLLEMRQALFERIAYPGELLSLANKAVGAIGPITSISTPTRQAGSCFFLDSDGLLLTCHHVLMDAGWTPTDPSRTLHVGVGETIDWQYTASVVTFSPSPKEPAPGKAE